MGRDNWEGGFLWIAVLPGSEAPESYSHLLYLGLHFQSLERGLTE